ncbi:MAG: chemotaxis protein CheD [Planctomycetota bacterium]|jgi:chemotaxis protein CheD
MANVVLGVGDYGAVKGSEDVIKTYALGSCVAAIIMDAETHVVGMVHIALPESKISPDKVKDRPGYFADTGIPVLLENMKAMGVKKIRSLIVKLVGGACVMDPNSTFNIGKRNILAVKKILWKNGMGALAEDVGGNISRTVSVSVKTGKVVISSPGKDNWEI